MVIANTARTADIVDLIITPRGKPIEILRGLRKIFNFLSLLDGLPSLIGWIFP
jgi:hypothetical protein